MSCVNKYITCPSCDMFIQLLYTHAYILFCGILSSLLTCIHTRIQSYTPINIYVCGCVYSYLYIYIYIYIYTCICICI